MTEANANNLKSQVSDIEKTINIMYSPMMSLFIPAIWEKRLAMAVKIFY